MTFFGGRARAAVWLSVLAAIHTVATFYFERPELLFSDVPLGGADFDTHFGQASRFVDAMNGWGKSWSYDPSLLAGRPAGVLFDCDNKGWELWTYVLHGVGLSKGFAFNSFVLLAFLVVPWIVFAAARLFRLSFAAGLIGSAIASACWFFDSQTHYFWWIGMVAWVLGSHVVLLALGTFYRYVQAPGVVLACGVGLLFGLCLFLHPFTCFVLAPPVALFWWARRESFGRAAHAGVVGSLALAIAVNAFWIGPAVRFRHYAVNFGYFGRARPIALLHDLLELAVDPNDTGLFMRTGFRFLVWGAAMAGLVRWRKDGDDRFLPLAATFAWLVAVSYLGRYVPLLDQVQPYRFVVAATLLALLPAANFATDPRTRRALSESSSGAKVVLAIVALPAMQLLARDVLYFLPGAIPAQAGRPPERDVRLSPTGYLPDPDRRHGRLPPGGDAVVAWFAAHRELEGRILVEPSVVGERLAALVPGIQVMGGIRERNLVHANSNFFRQHPDRNASPDDFGRYLEKYAVRWVVLHAEQPFPGPFADLLHVRAKLPDGVICETTTPVSFFQEGTGSVRASMNRIEVHGALTATPVVLRYHWLETLVCEPGCRAIREAIQNDPVGFIRIPTPHPADFVVKNAY